MRTAWGAQYEVVVALKDARPGPDIPGSPADRKTVRGYIEHVASTGAFALMWDGGSIVHVPTQRVMGVLRTHYSMEGKPVSPREREPIIMYNGQLAFDFAV
jgi:hypothetical protein